MGKQEPFSQADTAVFSQLREENAALKQENEELRRKLERMNELLLNAQRARFGRQLLADHRIGGKRHDGRVDGQGGHRTRMANSGAQ